METNSPINKKLQMRIVSGNIMLCSSLVLYSIEPGVLLSGPGEKELGIK